MTVCAVLRDTVVVVMNINGRGSIQHPTPDIIITRNVRDESFFAGTQCRSSCEESVNVKTYLLAVLRKVSSCTCPTANGVCSFINRLAPVLRWLPKYNWKEDLLPDITGGVTVGIMHIPLGNVIIIQPLLLSGVLKTSPTRPGLIFQYLERLEMPIAA